MKTSAFILLVTVPFLCSCSKKTEIFEDTIVSSVRFQVSLEPDILPFDTKSMPGNLPSEPNAENGEVPEPDPDPEHPNKTISKLEYAVYDADGNFIKHQQHQSDSDSGFKTLITDDFKAGVYTICFLAHSSDNVSRENNLYTFPAVTESFYNQTEIEIEAGKDQEVTIELSRIVARVEFKAKDAVPADVTQFHITSSAGIYPVFDIWEGKATNTTQALHLNQTVSTAGPNPDHAFYTFVPQTKASALDGRIEQILLEAKNKDNLVLRTKTISSIPIYPNRITRYTGILYTACISDSHFEININTEWGQTIDNDLDQIP